MERRIGRRRRGQERGVKGGLQAQGSLLYYIISCSESPRSQRWNLLDPSEGRIPQPAVHLHNNSVDLRLCLLSVWDEYTKITNAIMPACEANRMCHVAMESVSKLRVTPAPGLFQREDVFTGTSVGYATLGAILSCLHCNHGAHGRQTSESESAERKLYHVRANTYQLFWHNNEQWRQSAFWVKPLGSSSEGKSDENDFLLMKLH